MMNQKKRFILLWILLIMIIVFIVMNVDGSKNNAEYKITCFNCTYYDYTEYVKNIQPGIFFLDNKKIENIVLTYSRFMSKKGKLTLSYTYNENGNKKRFYGVANDIEPADITWSPFNDVRISFMDGRMIIYADDNFKENNMSVLFEAAGRALNNSQKIK